MTMIKASINHGGYRRVFPLTSVMAQEFTQEQIDAIVAKAVDKALADRRKNRRRGQQGRRDY